MGASAYIISTKPEPIYTNMEFITGEAFDTSPEPYGSGDYASVDYPTGVVYPYTP